MHSITIIGTNPPCPRRSLLTNTFKALVKEQNLDIEVRHIAFTDDEAIDFTKELNLVPGTAKDVAQSKRQCYLNDPLHHH